MGEEKRSKIEDLERRLYSKNGPQIIDEGRSKMVRGEFITSADWSKIEDKEAMPRVSHTQRNLKIALTLSVLFFLISGAFAGYMFFRGGNNVSANNVEILIEGPTEISSGETTSWDVVVKNNNSVDLESATLTVEYPKGSKKSGDLGVELSREKIALNELKSSEERKETISAILYGEKGSTQSIKLNVEFRVAGSNALFSKVKSYDVEIFSAPLVIDIDYPSEISVGEEITFNLWVSSNSDAVLKNLSLRAEYPFGFEYIESQPKPIFETNIWKIEELKPGEKTAITLTGKIIGGEGEERVFRFISGTADTSNPRKILNELARQNVEVSLNKPFINLATDIEGNLGREYIAFASKNTRVSLGWKNNLKDKIIDSTVEVSFIGEILNKNDVNPGGGTYRPEEALITWDKTSLSTLSEIIPSESGSVSFGIKSLSYTKLTNKNVVPEIILKMKIAGKQVSESGVPKLVTTNIERKIKISSDLTIDQKIVHSIGPFKNTGPIPPKVDQETTYTIIWTVTNSFNNLKGAKAIATIPSYVKWLGKISPQSENIAFNPTTNQIVWSVGEIKKGSGYGSAAREVAFQVSLKPSGTQVQTLPDVISKVKITAEDQFTLQQLQAEKGTLTTSLSSDPNFDYSAYRVVK